MISPDAEAGYKSVVTDLAKVLKSHGFRKKHATFKLDHDGNVIIVSFQRSPWNRQNELKFTVNLGILSVRLFALEDYHGRTLDSAREYQCHLRERLGFLMPNRHDKWWDGASVVEDGASDEIIGLLENKALPYLKSHASDAALIRLWQSGQSPGLTEKQADRHLAELLAISDAPQSETPE